MTNSYRTGSWTAVLTPTGLALLSPDFAAVTVRSLWDIMSEGQPLSAWLEVIAGGGIAALPDFVLVQPEEDQVRVLVRGRASAEVDGTAIRAEGMSTWREHVGPSAASVQVNAPEDGGEQWPLGTGVVLAAEVRTGASSADDDVTQVTVVAAGDDGPESGDAPESGEVPVESEEPDGPKAADADPAAVGHVGDEPADVGDAGANPEDADAASADTGHSDSEGAARDVAAPEVLLPPLSAEQAQEGPGFTDADTAEDGAAGVVEDHEPDDDVPRREAESDSGEDRGLIDSLPWNVPALKAGADSGESLEATVIPDQDADQDHPHSDGQPADAGGDDVGATIGTPTGGSDSIDEDASIDEDGDHDGHTILVADLHREQDSEGAGLEDTVRSGGPHAGQPSTRPIAVLVLSTGQRVDMDRAALLGRVPEAARFGGTTSPHLVTVPSPQQDISRTHVEIKPEGDHVVVTDLRSTNGTVVTLPGADARRLHPGESIPVGVGAVIDLGDGVTAEIESADPAPDDHALAEDDPGVGTPPPHPGGDPQADPQHPAGQPGPYGQPARYGGPGPYGQPAPYGRPGPYGYPPVPPGPGVPPPPGSGPSGQPAVPPPPGSGYGRGGAH